MGNYQQNSRLSKPYALLKTFSEEELNSFAELIKSNYLTDKEEPYLLLKSLRRYALPSSDKFTFEFQLLIFKAVFKKEVIKKDEKKKEFLDDRQKKKLSKAMNDLLHLAEIFLKFEAIRAEEKNKENYNYDIEILLPELNKRNQKALYEKHKNAIEKRLVAEKKQGVDYHNKWYKIEAEKEKKLFITNGLGKEDNYNKLQTHLDTKYLIEKLQYHLAKITLKDKYEKKVFDFKPFNALQPMLNLPEYKSNILIKLYTLSITLINTDNEFIFNNLMDLLKEKHKFIPDGFLKPFYTNLTNYCIDQLIKGDLKYYHNMFQIYSLMDKSNLIVDNASIDIGLLKNIITIACRVKAFDWATTKLNKYKKFIPNELRSRVFKYNRGIIDFNKGEYELALGYFKEIGKIDSIHDLNLKIVQLECFYETDLVYEAYTEQFILSLKVYIKQQKKLTTDQKDAYLNFIKIFSKLYKFKKISEKRSFQVVIEKELPTLKKQFFKFNLMREKTWLLAKFKALESYL